MTSFNGRSARAMLRDIARRAMIARGLEPEFSPAALAQSDALSAAAPLAAERDLRALPWCSIDNDDSRDLDQLSVLRDDGGADDAALLIAVADVASLVPPGTPLDRHARHNTTSVYTAADTFPMLPERLSTDLTSLAFDRDRLAFVVEMHFTSAGELTRSNVYQAVVRNRAKLAYNSLAAWLEAKEPPPAAVTAVAGLADNLQRQNQLAQRLRALRHQHGALSLETVQARAVFENGGIKTIAPERTNTAKQLIEDFMIAANGVVARFLAGKGFPSMRRVVRTPKNWPRIVALAAEHGGSLPVDPDSRALDDFLQRAQAQDPLRFPDLSLGVIKLLGAGEYVVEFPGQGVPGHFGLAVKDYAHSTAPNRRYPDLITQRLLKAAVAGKPVPYANDDLTALATHCTTQEDAAKKVERQVAKSAAACVLAPRIGESFNALVTGAADKGTWVRLLDLPVEGKLVNVARRVEVGQRTRVRLVHVDIERGFIDFVPA